MVMMGLGGVMVVRCEGEGIDPINHHYGEGIMNRKGLMVADDEIMC